MPLAAPPINPTHKDGTGFSNLFKVKYEAFSSALWMTGASTGDAFLAKVPKVFKNQGRQLEFPIQITFGGSTSVGELGYSTNAQSVTVTVPCMSLYTRLNLDRKSMKMSKGDGAAYVDSLGFEVENKVMNSGRTEALLAYNNDSAILGQFVGQATGTAPNFVVTIPVGTGTFRARLHYFEEDDIVEIEKDVLGTPLLQESYFRITSVAQNNTTKVITLGLLRVSGSVDIAAVGYASQTHNIVIQKGSTLNSHRNYIVGARRAPMGVLGCMNFTTGTRYGVNFTRRFSSRVVDAASTNLTPDVLIDGIFDYESRTGIFPSLIVASYAQFTSALKLAEGTAIYKAVTTSGVGPVQFGFKGVEILTPRGSITMVTSRFLRDDIIFYTNPEKHKQYLAGPFGWFEDDGTMLLRLSEDDAYEARYGGYYENYFNPFFFHFVQNLVAV